MTVRLVVGIGSAGSRAGIILVNRRGSGIFGGSLRGFRAAAPGLVLFSPHFGARLAGGAQLSGPGQDVRDVVRLVDALEDSDDVQDVYTNIDIPDDVAALLDDE